MEESINTPKSRPFCERYKFLLYFVIFLLVIAVAVLGWFVYDLSGDVSNTDNPVSTEVSSDDDEEVLVFGESLKTWSRYSNDHIGISILLPPYAKVTPSEFTANFDIDYSSYDIESDSVTGTFRVSVDYGIVDHSSDNAMELLKPKAEDDLYPSPADIRMIDGVQAYHNSYTEEESIHNVYFVCGPTECYQITASSSGDNREEYEEILSDIIDNIELL